MFLFRIFFTSVRQVLLAFHSWRDSNCPFRKDPRTHLVSLPTLLRWKSPQRLDAEQCSDARLVGMIILCFANEFETCN